MANTVTSNVEFDQNFNTALTLGQSTQLVYSAFSLGASIITVSIAPSLIAATVVNAGYYADLVLGSTTAVVGTSFDIGYGTNGGNGYYTSAVNKLATTTVGPSNTTAGYGTLEINSTLVSAGIANAINFNGTNNTLILDTTSLTNLALLSSINNFQGNGDQIVFNGVSAVNAQILGYSNGVLTFSNNGVTSTAAFGGMAGTVTASNFTIGGNALVEGGNSSTHAGSLVIGFATCFLRGTMIATPSGEVPVETLRAGDLVTAVEAGQPVERPVCWVGGRALHAADHEGQDAAFPIRIRRGAFADNVPHRDLLVTPEHCILTEAGLTPARMLVNGDSILVDRSIPEYEFFHVELERHGILLSEGLTTESYLDTGNRALFVQAGPVAATRPDAVMAAPLVVARAVVEPIWHRLADRARTLGLAADRAVVAFTDQPDLRVLLDDGREVSACWHNAQRHMFQLPRGTRPVRLLSRAAVPAETVGPFVDDRRTLGVAVDKLVLWHGLEEQVVQPNGRALDGWHDDDGARWTDGNAELDLPCAGTDVVLDIHLAATMLYRDEARLAA